MSVNYEKGQKLKCVRIPDRHHGYFTIGKEYTVLSVDYQDDHLPVKMSCDTSIPLWCEASAFEDAKPDGGPAFGEFQRAGDISLETGGMSLRDYFAAKADSADIVIILHEHYEEWRKTGVLEGYQQPTRQQARYMHADLMLAERAK